MTGAVRIQRALFSVSDKTYLEELAKSLTGFGIEFIATGGTADRLRRSAIKFRPIEDFTGNPEAFDGRMKTLSFKLESALLYDRANSTHVEQAKDLGIEPIDLVVCNFYPFEEAVSKGSSEADLIHEVDIGGPTMVRAAAKNHHSVVVLTDPSDYAEFMTELRSLGGCISFETRRRLAVKAFERVLRYDQSIYEAFAKRPLRYGENPHQPAYFVPDFGKVSMEWQLLEPAGLDLSYNNILDAQAALGAVRDARELTSGGHGACAIVKHNNPCGLATAPTIDEAFLRAWAGDPVSAFGGVVAFSSMLTLECARLFEEKFVEVVLAPGFEDGAIEVLRRKKKKLRVIKIASFETSYEMQRMRVEGGYLVQHPDEGLKEEFKTATQTKFPDHLAGVARFGVVAAKWIKSNAIAIVRMLPDGGFQLVGMGSGQPNRVDAIRRLAVPKAREALSAQGLDAQKVLSECVLVSDAFFPFGDNVEEAHAAGLRYIVQPGGSIRDPEVVATCDKLGVAMVFTGKRHFRH
ncbi:MAG: bifunctional phosphoribosylaminoimidazolecarboxamide formyltransferase/IMP cyclohydrolase [Bdellovibrionota bacterium]